MHKEIKSFYLWWHRLLGYYSALEFLRKGIAVDTLALPVKDDTDLKALAFGSQRNRIKIWESFRNDRGRTTGILRGYEAMVYAVGPDDRVVPKAPAYQFFYDRLCYGLRTGFQCRKESRH